MTGAASSPSMTTPPVRRRRLWIRIVLGLLAALFISVVCSTAFGG